MRYEVSGTLMQTVAIDLAPGETVYSQTNTMAWMNDQISMNTHTGGGLFSGIMRTFGGGSLFVTEFTANGNGHVAFAPRFPGTIIPALLQAGQSLICRKETFLVAEKSVTLETVWQRKVGAGFFGGNGFVLQKVTGPGVVWLDLSGELVERDLAPGRTAAGPCRPRRRLRTERSIRRPDGQRLQEHPVRRRRAVSRYADRPRASVAAEHADPQPRGRDRALHAEFRQTPAAIRQRERWRQAPRSARRAGSWAASLAAGAAGSSGRTS